jgi:hypothetical protein
MQTKSKEVCAKPFAKSGNKRALEVNLPIHWPNLCTYALLDKAHATRREL